jgi:hypothetical protein
LIPSLSIRCRSEVLLGVSEYAACDFPADEEVDIDLGLKAAGELVALRKLVIPSLAKRDT